MVPFLLGVLLEVLGYFLRRASAGSPDQVGLFIGQTLPIILAPAFLAASVYMSYGRIITFVGERHSSIRATRVTRIFVCVCRTVPLLPFPAPLPFARADPSLFSQFDVLSFFIQGAGGGLQSSSSSNPALAKAVLIVGFVIQIISFAVFALLASLFHRRALRAGEHPGRWTKCLWTLYAGVALVTVRNVFRTVEFATSTSHNTGFILEHEALYYALEAVPIVLCAALFLVSNPAGYLPQDMNARLNGAAEGAVGGQTYELGRQGSQDEDRKGRWMNAVRSVGHKV